MSDLLDQLHRIDGPVDPGARFRERLWDVVDAELQASDADTATVLQIVAPMPVSSPPAPTRSRTRAGLAWVRASRTRTVGVAAGLVALLLLGAGTFLLGGPDADGDQSVNLVDEGPTPTSSPIGSEVPSSPPSTPPRDRGDGVGAPAGPRAPGSGPGSHATVTPAPAAAPFGSAGPSGDDSRWVVVYAATTQAESFGLFTARAGSRDAPKLIFRRPGVDMHPVLSPDRRTLAWTGGSDPDTTPRAIWTADAQGRGARALPLPTCGVYAACDYMWPTFAPDGRHLAAHSGSGNSDCVPAQDCTQIVVYDFASRTLTGVAYGYHPDWSPRRDEIVYAGTGEPQPRSACDATCQDKDIRIVDLSGSSPRSRALGVSGNSPRFSPDGNWITFASVSGTGDAGVVRRDGSGLRVLAGCQQPNWTPDGRLACIRSVDGGSDVFLLGADDEPAERLTFTREFETQFRLYAL